MPVPRPSRISIIWRSVPFLAALGFVLALAGSGDVATTVSQASAAENSAGNGRPVFDYDGRVAPLLQKYCLDCHTGESAEAGLDLAQLLKDGIPRHRRTFEKTLDLVRLGNMPPSDAEQPSPEDRDLIAAWLDDALFYVDCSQPSDPGRVTVRRLNRAEYNNSVRDLLAVDFQPAADFPLDDVGYGFDNIGDVLTVPPLLIEKYLDAAEQIVQRSILTPEARQVRIEIPPSKFRGGDGVHDGPNGSKALITTTEITVPFPIPEAGEYSITVEAFGDQAGDEPVKMELRPPGKEPKDFAIRRRGPRSYTYPVAYEAGDQTIGIAFTNDFYDEKAGQDRNLYVQRVEISGPNGPPLAYPESHRRAISVMPDDGRSVEDAARDNLRPFLRRAFRRPVPDEVVESYVRFVKLAVDRKSSFERGMQIAVQAVLVSPDFLFRPERIQETDPHGRGVLDDFSIASRLSYFLWSAPPDEELLAAADAGQLRTDEGLRTQALRLLKDPRSSALVTNFASQWLALRKLKTEDVTPSRDVFPEFEEALRADMARETELFVESVIRDDRSIFELLTGPYTFLNGRLAKVYGIPGVEGDEFRRVELTDGRRMGLMTQPAVLTLTSYPTRTSPVKRGQWVLETLLGDEPPPPPPAVPGLEETQKSSPNLPLRKQLELHRADPGCAACHKTMDEIGFGLENFDGIGRWREADGPHAIDATGKLPSGEEFRGPGELVAILAGHKDDFRRCLAEKLLTYALGRGLEYFDRCTVDQIVQRLGAQEDRFSELVLGIVLSDPFRLAEIPSP